MPNMELLQDKITSSGMTVVAIAEKSGVERTTLYNRLNGKGEWKVSEVTSISNVLRLSNEERDAIFLA